MSNFTNNDYINMKKNAKEIFKGNIHENRVKEMMNDEWENIRDFPHQNYKKIKEWQLKMY